MLEVFLALTASFPANLYGVMLINIVFLFTIVVRPVIINRPVFICGFLFAAWVLVTGIAASIIYPNLEYSLRVLIQTVFSIQYFILAFKFELDFLKFASWFSRVTVLFAIGIILAFFLTGTYSGWTLFSDRLWGADLFPGWPNGLSVPLGFALWGVLQKDWIKKKKYLASTIISIALFLTTSRGSMLIAIALWLWHFYTFGLLKQIPAILRVVFIVLVIGLSISLLSGYMDDNFMLSLTRTHDRESITNDSLSLIELSPIFGYGGRTLEQIDPIVSIPLGIYSDTHTHNMVLEIAIRHGVVGLILFVAFLVSLLSKVKGSDQWVILICFLLLGLTQDFVRNFDYLFCLYMLAYYCSDEKCSCNAFPSLRHRKRLVKTH